MKLINPFFPVYLIDNFYTVDNFEKKKITKVVINNLINSSVQYRSNYEIEGANYEIKDNLDFFVSLYDKFYNICTKEFRFTPSVDNEKKCFAYVNNKKFFNSFIHNHKNTCTINSVYYLNVPDKKSGDIIFYLNGLTFSYHPKNFDLLIFPDYLDHYPEQNKKNDWRISINMEIRAKEISTELFSRLKNK